jgi:hypothetical protein
VLGDGDRLEPDALEALELQLGRIAAAALTGGQ